MARLGDVCEILDSKRVPITASNRKAGIYPYYGANGIQDYVDDYIFDDELVLLAEDGGHFGSTDKPIAYRVSGKCWVNNHAHVLKPKADLDVDYLCYSLMFKDVSNIVNGATRQKLTQADMKEIDIPLISLDKQTVIVNKLNKIFELITLRKQQLSKLDKLVKSRFIELFGLPNLNDKGWLKGVINDIGICVAGATPSTQVKEYWENGTIPWMSSGEVNKGRVFETDTKITQLGYNNASTKLVPPKTVVLAMAGQGKTRGTAAITEIELCTNQSICSIVNNEKVNSEYLLYFLKLQYMELRGASTNTDGRGGLNLKIIGNYPIMIPPIELQNQFAAFVEQVDKSKLAIQKSLEKLEILKKSLMQQYFG